MININGIFKNSQRVKLFGEKSMNAEICYNSCLLSVKLDACYTV